MSILSGFKRFKDYFLTDSGYVLSSRWTKSDAVVMGDGTDDTNTLEKNLGSINGITDSLTATSSNVALSAAAGKNLQDQLTSVNSDLDNIGKTIEREDLAALQAGEWISSFGLILDSNATYICTLSIDGTANKDATFYLAAKASIGMFDFIGSDGAICKSVANGDQVASSIAVILKTEEGTQKLALYANSSVYLPNITVRMGAIRIR